MACWIHDAAATINTHGLDVDSQSLVVSDYYVESADRMMEFSAIRDPAAA